ncbi:hypothetical protein [Novosphingobium sp.]|uniref:hypothetical protein n=1 Tax=Novosphingobium sp. TaxID=1874826 RepID=UPI0038B9B4B3
MDDGSGNPDGQAPETGADTAGETTSLLWQGPTELVLEAALIEAGIEFDKGGDPLVIASDAIKGLKSEAVDLADKLDAAESSLADIAAERDKLQADLEAAARAPQARNGSTTKLRKVAVLDNPKPDELLEQIRTADLVEIVFSDGKRELPSIAPRVIEGQAWQVNFIGLALNVPELLVEATGPGEIAGYALFLDGKQAAWAPRPDLLRVGPGAKMNLQGDVLFAPAP